MLCNLLRLTNGCAWSMSDETLSSFRICLWLMLATAELSSSETVKLEDLHWITSQQIPERGNVSPMLAEW